MPLVDLIAGDATTHFDLHRGDYSDDEEYYDDDDDEHDNDVYGADAYYDHEHYDDKEINWDDQQWDSERDSDESDEDDYWEEREPEFMSDGREPKEEAGHHLRVADFDITVSDPQRFVPQGWTEHAGEVDERRQLYEAMCREVSIKFEASMKEAGEKALLDLNVKSHVSGTVTELALQESRKTLEKHKEQVAEEISKARSSVTDAIKGLREEQDAYLVQRRNQLAKTQDDMQQGALKQFERECGEIIATAIEQAAQAINQKQLEATNAIALHVSNATRQVPSFPEMLQALSALHSLILTSPTHYRPSPPAPAQACPPTDQAAVEKLIDQKVGSALEAHRIELNRQLSGTLENWNAARIGKLIDQNVASALKAHKIETDKQLVATFEAYDPVRTETMNKYRMSVDQRFALHKEWVEVKLAKLCLDSAAEASLPVNKNQAETVTMEKEIRILRHDILDVSSQVLELKSEVNSLSREKGNALEGSGVSYLGSIIEGLERKLDCMIDDAGNVDYGERAAVRDAQVQVNNMTRRMGEILRRLAREFDVDSDDSDHASEISRNVRQNPLDRQAQSEGCGSRMREASDDLEMTSAVSLGAIDNLTITMDTIPPAATPAPSPDPITKFSQSAPARLARQVNIQQPQQTNLPVANRTTPSAVSTMAANAEHTFSNLLRSAKANPRIETPTTRPGTSMNISAASSISSDKREAKSSHGTPTPDPPFPYKAVRRFKRAGIHSKQFM